MKNTLRILSVALVLGIVQSCEKPRDLNTLKAEREALNKEIATLEAAEGKPVTVRFKEVSATTVEPKPFEYYVTTQGNIEAEDNILLSSESMGLINQVLVKEGQQVRKGQVLAQIDNTIILRNIEALKTNLELAITVFNRQKNLWDQKIGTEVQYLQAKTNKEGLERQLDALNEQNNMTRIKSSIDGVVDEVFVKVGENIAPGMPAVRVLNNSRLKVVANVSEAYANKVKVGNKVTISLPDLGEELSGTVTFSGRNIDPLSRTFKIEVSIKSGSDIRPNMTAVLRVVFKTIPSAIAIPVNVVQTVNNEKVVYIAESKGKEFVARRKVIEIKGVYDNQAEVTGLNAGEKLITFGYQGLNDGESIKL